MITYRTGLGTWFRNHSDHKTIDDLQNEAHKNLQLEASLTGKCKGLI